MKKVITIGEILVEIMATEPGDGFLEPIPLVGPFPSGAPAIFIDQVAKLGQPCGIIACVGNDDFGRVNTRRLARDGVDVSAIATHPSSPPAAPSSATAPTARATSSTTSPTAPPAPSPRARPPTR